MNFYKGDSIVRKISKILSVLCTYVLDYILINVLFGGLVVYIFLFKCKRYLLFFVLFTIEDCYCILCATHLST